MRFIKNLIPKFLFFFLDVFFLFVLQDIVSIIILPYFVHLFIKTPVISIIYINLNLPLCVLYPIALVFSVIITFIARYLCKLLFSKFNLNFLDLLLIDFVIKVYDEYL